MNDHDLTGRQITMRANCPKCGCSDGTITTRGCQDTVRCAGCDHFCYNAPRTETGRAVRTVQTTHENIKPKQRSRILDRANGVCEICHNARPLDVGHALSVAEGHKQGLGDDVINSDENLLAICSECNLGISSRPISLRLLMAITVARYGLNKDGGNGHQV